MADGWTVRWQASDLLAAQAAVGHGFASTLEYQLRDGRNVRVDVPSGTFDKLGIGARF